MVRRFSSGKSLTTRCRKSATSSMSRSCERTSLMMIESAYWRSESSSAAVSSRTV